MTIVAHTRSRARAARRIAACFSLLAAMALSQWLGVVHASLHAESASASASHAGHTHATHSRQAAGSWLIALFGGHGSDSECRLYDHVSHGDCAPALTPVRAPSAPIPLVATAISARLWGAVPGWAQARGPPFIR